MELAPTDSWDVRLIDFGLAKMVGIKQEEKFFGGMMSVKKGLSLKQDDRDEEGERGEQDRPGERASAADVTPARDPTAEVTQASPSDVRFTANDAAAAKGEAEGEEDGEDEAGEADDEGGAPLYVMTGGTGSFKYMAPEVFLGRRANETLDVYSLSIIAYELLTRQIFLSGMRKQGVGYSCEYTGDEWAKDAAIEGWRPDLEVVPESSGWRPLLPQMWEGDPAARISAAQVVNLLVPMRDLRKCTDPKKKSTGCGCVVM